MDLSPTSSPYITAPSSPKHFPEYNSSSDDIEIEFSRSSCSSIAFDRDTIKPKPCDVENNEDDDYQDITFEFCVDRFHSFSLPAEELFDGGKIRTLKPAPAVTDLPPPLISQTKRKIVWSTRRSYDFYHLGGTCKPSKFSRLRSMLSFRRPSSSSERGSTTSSSKNSTSFGSTGSSSSGSGSGWGVKYLSGSVHEPDDTVTRDEVKSCLTPCKQRLLSCFVKKL